MQPRAIRRSARILLEVPIQASGNDSLGKAFAEETCTVTVSQHGAKILLKNEVPQGQRIVVRHLRKGRTASARIVWVLGLVSGGYHCGIEFLDPDANLWEIDFPLVDALEGAMLRLLLECTRCHSLRVFDLDAYEAERIKTTESLVRPCARCNNVVLWQLPSFK